MKAFVLTLLGVCLMCPSVLSEDWPHWRGLRMNGLSGEASLPDSWSPKGENLLWRKEEYGTRSSPVVMNGRVYLVCRAFPETTKEGEKTVCLDAVTGELLWESIHNVYLSDAPAERVGWSSVICDPDSERIYVLGLGCVFQCLDAKTGKIYWERSMSEEFGMLSTYGGRTNFPVVFEDLVIISGVMTGWGETAVPAHRFIAFDKITGESVWFISTQPKPKDTTYSTPVFARFNGQDAMVVGAGDGAIYALQPRTGKIIWKYQASTRGLNTTPLVDERGIVYCGHSEQNANDTTILGSIFAFDGNTTGEVKESDLLWKQMKRTVARSTPVKLGDRVYFIEDGANLVIVEAATGRIVGEKKLGRIMFGSMVHGDGKFYAIENTGRSYILKPSDKGVDIISQTRLSQGEEVFGSPAISDGRIYIPTIEALYCVGLESAAKPVEKPARPRLRLSVSGGAGSGGNRTAEIATILLTPVENLIKPGETLQLSVRAYDEKGRFLKEVTEADITVEGGGSVSNKLLFTAPDGDAPAAVTLKATVGDLTASARVRVIPALPWKFDFNDGKVPPTWIGANYRHKPAKVEGEDVLVKISTIPLGTRSQGWMGWTDLHDYTIQADFLATETDGRLPDMGLVNQRYTLDLQGSQHLQIRSWTPRLELRFARTVDMQWSAGTWYTMKFQSENKDGKAILRGKIWPRNSSEPTEWQIEAADETPNVIGSPGMFGKSSDAEFYIDNVQVYAN
ncbi:MAG: PQQ-binding-like beta-propeller repeat protein [Planctomycetaceae bacterium]